MARNRHQSFLDDLLELLKLAPTWVGPVLALAAFVLLRYLAPIVLPAPKNGVDPGVLWLPMFSMFSWISAGTILLVWVIAEGWKLFNRRMLDKQTGIESIRDLSWREFERLVSEAYRRKGYVAEIVGTASGDGGVDIRLNGRGALVLVQCKQWKAYKVGVTTVRELLGVVVSERADRGIIVTSGRFTQEAVAFARQNRQIELMDGPELADLIRGVQTGATAPPPRTPVPVSSPAAPSCPLCGITMILRTARKGQNAGSQFWGCPKYPTCKGTRPILKSSSLSR